RRPNSIRRRRRRANYPQQRPCGPAIQGSSLEGRSRHRERRPSSDASAFEIACLRSIRIGDSAQDLCKIGDEAESASVKAKGTFASRTPSPKGRGGAGAAAPKEGRV